MFRNLGLPEILLILLVILLFFGARKLPDLARSLGRSLNEFKKGQQEGAAGAEDQKKEEVKSDSPPRA